MEQRKIQISEIETYNTKLTNIKSYLESKLNSYSNHLNNLSNENAIEGAVKSQLESFCSDIKTFLNTEVSQKLEAFTNSVKKDIESVKSTDSGTASKINNILGNNSSTSGPSLSNMLSGTAVNLMMNQTNKIQAMGNAIDQGINNFDRMAGQGIRAAGNAIGNTATAAYNTAAQGLQAAGNAIGNTATTAYNNTVKFGNSVGKGIEAGVVAYNNNMYK